VTVCVLLSKVYWPVFLWIVSWAYQTLCLYVCIHICVSTVGWEDVNVHFLCGADLLESFSTPGLWAEEDVSIKQTYSSGGRWG